MDDGSPESGQESGGSLREKLEAALAGNASLTSELVSYKAKDLISTKGYKNVAVEDLAGVKLADLEAKADELEVTKGAQKEAVLREVLTAQGYEAKDLDAAVKSLLGTGDDAKAALSRISAVSKLPGQPPSKNSLADLHGPELLRAAMAE